MNDVEVIKEVIKIKDPEGAFYILDVGEVINKHRTWRSKMPRVGPHFAMTCNPNPTVVRTLQASFSCASKHEIEQVLFSGVPSERIDFANTVKPHSHIKFARDVGVNLLIVDSEFELCNMKSIFPEAKIVICFRCDTSTALTALDLKSGCDSVNEAPKIIRKAKDLGLQIYWFSFHVGSQCSEPSAWIQGIRTSIGLIDYAKSLGLEDVKLIDIGGGFPGEKGGPIEEFAKTINKVLDEIDPSIKVISEPGRYYVASAFTLVSLVFGKRTVCESNGTRYMYHINNGTYGSFIEAVLNVKTRIPCPLNKPMSGETHPSTIWGPICDSTDCVVRDCNFPKLNVGDCGCGRIWLPIPFP